VPLDRVARPAWAVLMPVLELAPVWVTRLPAEPWEPRPEQFRRRRRPAPRCIRNRRPRARPERRTRPDAAGSSWSFRDCRV